MLAQQHARRLAGLAAASRCGCSGSKSASRSVRARAALRSGVSRFQRAQPCAGSITHGVGELGRGDVEQRTLLAPPSQPSAIARCHQARSAEAALAHADDPSSKAPSLAMSPASGRRSSSGSGGAPTRHQRDAVLARQTCQIVEGAAHHHVISEQQHRLARAQQVERQERTERTRKLVVLEQHRQAMPVRRVGDTHRRGPPARTAHPRRVRRARAQSGSPQDGAARATRACTRTQANLRRGATTPTRRGVRPSSAGSCCRAEVIAGGPAHHRSPCGTAHP